MDGERILADYIANATVTVIEQAENLPSRNLDSGVKDIDLEIPPVTPRTGGCSSRHQHHDSGLAFGKGLHGLELAGLYPKSLEFLKLQHLAGKPVVAFDESGDLGQAFG